MTDLEDEIFLGKTVFDDTNKERKSWSCMGQTCSRSLIVFLSQLFVIFLIIFGWFRIIHLSKTCDESTVRLEVCAVRKDTFYPHHDYEEVNFYKKSIFFSLVGPSETGKSQLINNWLKIGTI